jgi:protoheme IX farnesyltransferase
LLKKYYRLTKPGIIYGNLISATAGFLLASNHHINLWLLLATLAGTSLVIASGCVFNNYLDRNIDKKMARTKKRALVLKTIPVINALVFAMVLFIAGFAVLGLYTNWLVVVIGLVGFVDYVVLYGYSKRHTMHSTLVGTVAGATPILAGYCAARGHFDSGAILDYDHLADGSLLWHCHVPA